MQRSRTGHGGPVAVLVSSAHSLSSESIYILLAPRGLHTNTIDLVDHAVGSLAVRLRHPLASGSNASFPARNSNAGESWPTWNEVTRTRPETLKRWPLLLVSLSTCMHTGGGGA